MKLTGRAIYEGKGEGLALVSTTPMSFYGGVNPDTGEIIERDNVLRGRSVSGRVLVFPHGKGSTVGSYVLYRLARNKVAPAAIVNAKCETIVAVGAIISEIPCVDMVDVSRIAPDAKVRVEGNIVEF